MKKNALIGLGTTLIVSLLLIQPTAAATSTVGFTTGSVFVWRWTMYTYNPDMTVNETTIQYRMMNVTAITDGTDHLNVSVTYPYTNQTDYEANGVNGSTWKSGLSSTRTIMDGNSSTWYNSFYCKNGWNTILNLLSMNDTDKYNAISTMHGIPVLELLILMWVMGLSSSKSDFWSNATASVSLAMIGYLSCSVDLRFGYMESGHWKNTTAHLQSSFTFSATSMVLKSLDTTFDMSSVEWNSTTSAYQTENGRSRHVYEAVYPSALASYVPVEWFIGGGVALLLVVVIAKAAHKHKK